MRGVGDVGKMEVGDEGKDEKEKRENIETTASQKSKAPTEHVPNSIPDHIVTTGLHDSDYILLLLFAEGCLNHDDGLEQVITNFLPLRHDGGKEEKQAEGDAKCIEDRVVDALM